MTRSLSRLEALAAAVALLTFCTGCEDSGDTRAPLFVDATNVVGLDFAHYTGATGEYFLPEIMGSGCGLLDYDGDGDLDIYVVQGAVLDKGAPPPARPPANRLFQNTLGDANRQGDDLTFRDVSAAAGVDHGGYGMGCATGDYDGDGDTDLYVTNFGSNVLYRNGGDGTFADVTRTSGVDDPRFNASASFLDYDRDGRLDLMVTAYVDFSLAANRECVRLGGQRDYCGPLSYEPSMDRLFHQNDDGTFTDVTVAAGLGREYGCGLGVVCADFDGDGWVDVFVANDATPNQLWMNRQDGRFENRAALAGVAVNSRGRNEAGMGVCAADFDRDGDLDLFLTHEMGESNTFYLNLGGGLFEDATGRFGLVDASFPYAGFGVGTLDYDNDGWEDLFIVNGAVRKLPDLLSSPHPYHQRDQLYRNNGGRFAEVPSAAFGTGQPRTGRGAAFGDLDNDGDIDAVVTNNSGPLQLYLNQTVDSAGARSHWVRIALVAAGRDARGAVVSLQLPDGTVLTRRVGSDGSYLSANDPRVHFGLGKSSRVESVQVKWLSGGTEAWDAIAVDRETTLREGDGRDVTARK